MNLTRIPCIVLFAILIAISTITVHAHTPEVDLTVLLNSGTPVIDGTMSTGEWDNAESKTFDMNLPGTMATVPATMFVMADDTNLYFAIKYQRDSLDVRNNFFVDFDNAHNGAFSFGDDNLQAEGSNSFTDRHIGSSSAYKTDVSVGGTNDGSAARTLASGFITHEISHPFNSADDSHDISMQLGDTVGFSVSTNLGAGGETFFPAGFPSGYGDLTLLLPPPVILSAVWDDADNADAVISAGDTLTLTFDIATNAPSVSNQAEIDPIVNVAGLFGTTATYSGAWSAGDTVLTITIGSVGTASSVIGGNVSPGVTSVTNAAGTSEVWANTVASTGDFGVEQCSLPTPGLDYVISSSCTLSSTVSVDKNVIVEMNAVLTILNGVTLNIDFSQFSITIESGSGVLIKAGGKIT